MAGIKFNPVKDIPNLDGKVILITGGNIGLGYESILQLSKHNPAKIYLGARNQSKAEVAIKQIKNEVPNASIEFLPMDLTSLQSIKQAADSFTSSSPRLDVLMNNAGIMACPSGLTKEGYEIQFGTNHVGHALLTKLLLPTLQETAQTTKDVRIVNLSSAAHSWAPKEGIIYPTLTTEATDISTWARYGQSKLANIYYTRELAKHHPEIKVTAIHPGGVRTNLVSGPLALYPWLKPLTTVAGLIIGVPVQEGAKNQLWASVSPDVKQGMYYEPIAKESMGTVAARDDAKAKELWD